MPDLVVRAFGTGSVTCGGRRLATADWTYLKSRELLFYLVCNSPRTKEQIGAALWPNVSTDQLQTSFRTTLHHLRRALGRQEWVLHQEGLYMFNRSVPYWLDVEAFEGLVNQARAAQAARDGDRAVALLTEAEAIYTGDLLETLEGEWPNQRREALSLKRLDALLARGRLLLEQGKPEQADAVYRAAVAVDGYSEAAHRGLLLALARQGEIGHAVRHYRALVRLLREELDTEPAEATQELMAHLRTGRAILV